jgi:hypothetical protein
MDYVLKKYLPNELIDIICKKVHVLNLNEVHNELKHKYLFKLVLQDINELNNYYNRITLKYTFPYFHNYIFGFAITQLREFDHVNIYFQEKYYDSDTKDLNYPYPEEINIKWFHRYAIRERFNNNTHLKLYER